jgi:hypothetical protein
LKGGIKESYENLEEGLFGRMGSLASGAVKKAGELMSGVNTNKGFRQEAILKHFEKLKTNLGSHLRELERDLETTSGIDTRVKDAVLRTVKTLTTKYGVTPTSSKFQDFRHKAGQVVQNVVTGAAIFAPAAAVIGPLAAAVGLTGAAATGVTSALAAATSSMIKDMVNGQTPNGKKAAIAGAAALVIGAGIKAGVDAFSTDSIVDDGYSGSGEDVPSNRDSEIARFKSDTTTEFDGKSLVDRGAIKMQTAFKDVGLSDTGSNFGSQNIFRNFAQDLANAAPSMKMNPEEIADLVKITLQDMTPEQLSSISDEASLRGGSAIKKFIDIMTNNEGFNQVKAQKLQNFANRFVKKWQ